MVSCRCSNGHCPPIYTSSAMPSHHRSARPLCRYLLSPSSFNSRDGEVVKAAPRDFPFQLLRFSGAESKRRPEDSCMEPASLPSELRIVGDLLVLGSEVRGQWNEDEWTIIKWKELLAVMIMESRAV